MNSSPKSDIKKGLAIVSYDSLSSDLCIHLVITGSCNIEEKIYQVIHKWVCDEIGKNNYKELIKDFDKVPIGTYFVEKNGKAYELCKIVSETSLLFKTFKKKQTVRSFVVKQTYVENHTPPTTTPRDSLLSEIENFAFRSKE